MVAQARPAKPLPLTLLALAVLLVASLAGAAPAAAKSDKASKHTDGGGAPTAASELVVHSADFNGTLQEGSSNGVLASIENTGSPTLSGFVVRFDIDGSWVSEAQMPAGFTGWGSPNAPQRWTATVGTHLLTVTVDADGQVPEGNEADNVLTQTFVVQPGPPGPPDLRIQNAGFVDPVDQEGQASRVWVDVQNAGSSTQGESLISFEVDGASLGTATIPAGFAGEQAFQSPQAWTATAGTHTLRVTVDAGDAVAESDESNNVFTATVTVQASGGGLPELHVQYAAMNGTAHDGVPIDAYASIENTGDPTPADSLVHFDIDGAWLGDATAPAGWTGIIAVSSPQRWTPTGGWHDLHVVVDAGGAVAESDESNNALDWSFYVDPADAKPDLGVPAATFTNGIAEGTWSDVTATIENAGPPTTVDTYVSFYVDDVSLGMALVSAGFDGSSLVHSPDGWTMQRGTHTLRVTVDATGAQDEADESNNVLQYTFPVGVAPPPPREAIFAWNSYAGAADSFDTTTITVPKDYRSVWYDLQCGATTIEVYLDGQLMATCVQGVRTATYPDTLSAGDHTFGVVYVGVGPAALQVTGVPMS